MYGPENALRLNFALALAATLGSLYFSEVMGFPPCTLCWYQRICIYPLVLIFGTALWTADRAVWRYALPLASVGLLIAVYHNLVYYGLIDEGLVPCQKGVSCSTRQLELFGFVTIPLMSMIGFAGICALSWWGKLQSSVKE